MTRAMNYGAIGAIIGHEISHGFDDEGRRNDANGNSVQWWGEETLTRYFSRAQCFVDQYDRYYPLNDTHVSHLPQQRS